MTIEIQLIWMGSWPPEHFPKIYTCNMVAWTKHPGARVNLWSSSVSMPKAQFSELRAFCQDYDISLKDIANQHEFGVLDNYKIMNDYLALPESIGTKRARMQAVSDILRISVLKRFGGMYFDTSVQLGLHGDLAVFSQYPTWGLSTFWDPRAFSEIKAMGAVPNSALFTDACKAIELSGGNLKSFNAQRPEVANEYTGMYLLDTARKESYSNLKIFALDLSSVVETYSLEWLWQNIWGKEVVSKSITSGLIAAQILEESERELLQFWTKRTFGECLEEEKTHPSLVDLKLAPKQTLASGFQCKAVSLADLSPNFISRLESGKFQCWSKVSSWKPTLSFTPQGLRFFKEVQASLKETESKGNSTFKAGLAKFFSG